jgi:hypothetical protein
MTTRGVSEAIDIAQGFGLAVEEAVLLRSTNNLVVWLSPAPVVAKVGIGRNQRLRLELEVALALNGSGAPVISPAREIPAVVHSRNGLDVTFWRYHSQPTSPDIAPARVAAALRRLHFGLHLLPAGLRARLPSYLRELELARALLDDASRAPALADDDRQLLAATFDRLLGSMNRRAPGDSHVVIHGSPHSYNVLLADGEPLFIDFETTCIGPVEWDAAYLDDEVLEHYGDSLDRELLWVCRGMASVLTAALCWSDVDHGDLREHAEMHLEHVRTQVAPYA